MAESFPTEQCDAESVFGEVAKRLHEPESIALWMRMRSEMERNGVPGAISYLESEYTRLREHFEQELNRAAPETVR